MQSILFELDSTISCSIKKTMMKVADGLPSGAQISEHFGGHRKKKVFLYLPPANTVNSNSQANTSSASTSASNAVSSNSQENTSSASSSGSNNAATIVTNARSGRPIMTPDVSSLPLPTSTNGSQQHNNSSSTRPIMTPAVSSMSLPSTGFNAASPSMATVVTNASSLSLPTNGRETRRYLTQMARNSIRADVYPLQIDDSDDEELLESPFENNGDTNVLTFPQVFQRQARRPVVTSTSTRPTSSGTSGFHGQPFYGDGMQVGTVTEDLSLHGVRGAPCNTQSRTSEVWRCENIMEVARNNVELPMLPLLNHSFEELCWQAQEARHPIVAVLLDPNGPNDLREDMLRALQRMMAVGSINEAEWLYWGAETSSEEGRKVLGLYVHERVNEDQIILLVPSPHQNPVFVARIQASDANNPGLGSVCERVAMMIQSLVLQREQLAHRREQRTDKKKKDKKSKDEGDAAEVR